jgi:hypothetical protein
LISFVAVSITSRLIIKFRAKYYNFRTYQMNTIGDMFMYFFGTITAQGTVTWGLTRDGTQFSQNVHLRAIPAQSDQTWALKKIGFCLNFFSK